MAVAEAQAATKVEAVVVPEVPGPFERPVLHARATTVPKLKAAAAAPVTPISAVTKNASRKRGRPRVLSDEQRRERVRQRVAGWRAAKSGKAGGSR